MKLKGKKIFKYCRFVSSSRCLVLPSFNRHDLIKKLHALKDTNSELAGLLLEQVMWVDVENIFNIF